MIAITALFTRNLGDPATGLVLTDIDLYLWRVNKSSGARSQLWDGADATLEVGGGLYYRAYTSEDWSVYNYYAAARYTGGVVLDSDWSLQASPASGVICDEGPGTVTVPYQLTSSVDGSPIPDADVWVTTDVAGANVIASGRTNSAGYVTFYLDPGTYYIWRQRDGWSFINPDTEVVS